MSKFILFTNGILAARYDVDIHGDNIPADAVPVTDELFFQTINEQDGIWSLVDGEIVKVDFPPPVITKQTQLTSLEFLDKFTEQEQIAVVTATLANPQVKLWYDKMLAASFVDLNDERVGFGLDALVGSGLLTEGRKQQIMTP